MAKQLARSSLLLASFLACFALLSVVEAFSPSVVVHNAHGAMNLRAQNTNSKFRLASTSLRMSSEPPADEQGDTVDISVEELRELATKAGVNVKFASEMREQQSAPAPPQERGPSVFQPLIEAAAPIAKLPPVLGYPLLLVIIGFASTLFLPLFGSSTLGDMTGAKKETAAEKAAAPAPQPKAEAVEKRSCDIFPYSLTPTCTDPNIGNKAILKNLDKYKKVPDSVLQERAAKEAAKAAAAAKAAE